MEDIYALLIRYLMRSSLADGPPPPSPTRASVAPRSPGGSYLGNDPVLMAHKRVLEAMRTSAEYGSCISPLSLHNVLVAHLNSFAR